MPKLFKRSIKLCYLESRQRAVCYVDGKRVILGPWPEYPKNPSAEVQAKFNRLVAQTVGTIESEPELAVRPTVAVLCAAGIRWAEEYYQETGGSAQIRAACRHLLELWADLPAEDLGPRHITALQNVMIRKGYSRVGINTVVSRIGRVVRRGVKTGMIPAATLTAIKAVDPLRRGRTSAKESGSRGVVPDPDIDAAAQVMRPQVAAMVRLQRLTGMRPGEVCAMTMDQIDRSNGDCWIYAPTKHKTAHRGKRRLVPLGPRAIALLKDWIRADGRPLFSPEESETARRGKAPAWSRRPGTQYLVSSYGHAVRAACVKAKVPIFSPQQLRKTRGQELRNQQGIEVSAAILGHDVDVSERYYTGPNFVAAVEAAKATG